MSKAISTLIFFSFCYCDKTRFRVNRKSVIILDQKETNTINIHNVNRQTIHLRDLFFQEHKVIANVFKFKFTLNELSDSFKNIKYNYFMYKLIKEFIVHILLDIEILINKKICSFLITN